MEIHKTDTAIVFIDPQNEVLSDKGLAWGAGGDSVRENKTVENMERIFKAARDNRFAVFISPHYCFPTDRWIVAFANILFQKQILTPEKLARKMDEVVARQAAPDR